MAARGRCRLRPVRSARALLYLLIVSVSAVAHAQIGIVGPAELEPPTEPVVETRSVTWPLMLDVHALIGFEPHDRGTLVAFGAGTEILWKARLGGFAELLASEGTPVVTPTVNGVKQPSFGDRISVPFGLSSRPLAWWFVNRRDWLARLATGVDVQLGLTVEHVRTSDDSGTVAGLHAALAVDVPLYGGPKQGGVALRLYARMMATPSISLDLDATTHQFTVYEPAVSAQFYCGLVYYP